MISARASRPASVSQRLFTREGVLCAFVFVACLLLTWPVAEVGINDDWVYTITTFDLARTGHFIFHGWASPILGWQALWGAFFVHLFGPTFTVVRLSMLPVAAATVLLFHGILRRFGLNSGHATFGTLCLALSPAFLPLSTSFMTDVPSLFALFVCIYFCQLALVAPDHRRCLLWLTAAAVTNIAFGTVRQIAWLGVLVIVPSCGWLLRRRRYVPQLVIALWLLGVAGIVLISHWYARQPYTAPEKLIPGHIHRQIIFHGAIQFVRAATTILLLLLPALGAGFSAVWPLRKKQAFRLAALSGLILLIGAVLARKGRADALSYPWLGNTLDVHGILQGEPMFGSTRAVPHPWLFALTFLVLLAVWASAETFAACRENSVSPQPPAALSWSQLGVLLLPLLAAYTLLLAPRAAFFVLFDRYLLEIVPVFLLVLLRWHQEHVDAAVPRSAIAMLVLVGALTIAGTHDLFSISRAEIRAADELQQAGVPRTEIRGGFAFDSATQVAAWGYLNDDRIQNPPGSWRPQPEEPIVLRDGVRCDYPFHRYVPALHIRYVISADPTPCLSPSTFPAQGYDTWLPPAHREVFIGLPVTRATNP